MPSFRLSFKKKEDEVPRRTAVFEIIKKGAKEEFLGEETYRTLSKRLSQEFEPPEGWIEVEGYPVYGRFVISSVHILYNEEDNEFIYHVNEPKLSEEEEKIVRNVISRLEYYAANPKEIGDKVGTLKKKIDAILEAYRVKLEGSDYFRVLYHIFKRTILYGKITPIMYDPMIEDISCNGYGKYIYIFHRKYTNLRTNVIFNDPDELDSFVVNLAQKCGKHISIAEPMVDATMPDGSRIQMTLAERLQTTAQPSPSESSEKSQSHQ